VTHVSLIAFFALIVLGFVLMVLAVTGHLH